MIVFHDRDKEIPCVLIRRGLIAADVFRDPATSQDMCDAADFVNNVSTVSETNGSKERDNYTGLRHNVVGRGLKSMVEEDDIAVAVNDLIVVHRWGK